MSMSVFVNGHPKTGTHALLKACELLGVPGFENDVHHTPFGESVPDGKHALIIRDPRDVVVSWLRMEGKPVTTGMFRTVVQQFMNQTFRDSYMSFAGWLTAPGVYVIRYEDLIVSDAAMRSLAAHLEVPYLDDAFPNLPGLTRTWNEQRSDHRVVWSPEMEAFWLANGGGELQEVFGY